eukprot:9709545-Lingulodinium_polyedra.AAC.1
MDVFVGDWPLESRAGVAPRGCGAQLCAVGHLGPGGVQQTDVDRTRTVPRPPDAGCKSPPG